MTRKATILAAACPFTPGEGPAGPGGITFNQLYEGDAIAGITDTANSTAFRTGQSDIAESLNGVGQVWVQAGNLVGSDAEPIENCSWHLVN